MREAFAFLAVARQYRLAAKASIPSLAASYKARARFWLAMARKAQGRKLP